MMKKVKKKKKKKLAGGWVVIGQQRERVTIFAVPLFYASDPHTVVNMAAVIWLGNRDGRSSTNGVYTTQHSITKSLYYKPKVL
jgi:hypothetical protein